VLELSKVSDEQKETAALILKTATGKFIWAWKIVCPAAAFFLFCRWAD